MDTRTANKQLRRERILNAARELITAGGYAALSTRALAQAAGVSAPTLYNLIGGKDDILEMLEMRAVETIEDRLRAFESSTPLEMAEAIVYESVTLFSSDEPYYKAAVIAADQVGRSTSRLGASAIVRERSISLAENACEAAMANGLLRGNLSTRALGEQMFICYRTPFEDWGYGLISLNEFARQALRGLYLCLAADAVERFRKQLLQKVAELETEHSRRAASAA